MRKVPDLFAIVSKAIFERDARGIALGDVWPVDRYISTNKALAPLETGGRIFLVTVRPPNEQLWLVGVLDQPRFDGAAWIARPNATPATNITALRKTIVFESGKGMLQDRGTLGMSLQMPRVLAASDVAQIVAAIGGAQPVPAPVTKPVRVIGGVYDVIRELGRGGMGVVYEARHRHTGRVVAVKEIAIGSDRQLIERFQREARATAAIDSRHVPPVIDAGGDPDPYLVMELLHGMDLQAYLDEHGPLGEDVALRIVAQACAGLVRAHAAGVVHRDIKPANLFLAKRDDEVVVQLLDFGVARVKEELALRADHALTLSGVMLGTPLYMSPEQVVAGAKALDHLTDLWSLAVVLYECLTGATPHGDAETLGGLMVSICGKPARGVRELAPTISEPVAAIVAKALALDPNARYPSAQGLLAALESQLPFGANLEISLM